MNLELNTEELLLDITPNTSTSSSQPTSKHFFKKRQCNSHLNSNHTEEPQLDITPNTSLFLF